MTVDSLQSADVHSESSRDRRTNLVDVQFLALDLAAFENIFGQGLQHCFLLQLEAEALHAANQPALPVTHVCQRFAQGQPIPMEVGPVCQLVDVMDSPHVMRRL